LSLLILSVLYILFWPRKPTHIERRVVQTRVKILFEFVEETPKNGDEDIIIGVVRIARGRRVCFCSDETRITTLRSAVENDAYFRAAIQIEKHERELNNLGLTKDG
jgi:hypothetical protein